MNRNDGSNAYISKLGAVFPSLELLDCLGAMKCTPIYSEMDLVAQISIASATIRKTPGIFEHLRQSISLRCRTFVHANGHNFEYHLWFFYVKLFKEDCWKLIWFGWKINEYFLLLLFSILFSPRHELFKNKFTLLLQTARSSKNNSPGVYDGNFVLKYVDEGHTICVYVLCRFWL